GRSWHPERWECRFLRKCLPPSGCRRVRPREGWRLRWQTYRLAPEAPPDGAGVAQDQRDSSGSSWKRTSSLVSSATHQSPGTLSQPCRYVTFHTSHAHVTFSRPAHRRDRHWVELGTAN